MRQILNHGQHQRYSHKFVGINGRMDTLQAAIVLEKFKIFPDEVIMRQRVADNYKMLLSPLVTTPTVMPGHLSVFAQYTIEVDNRSQIIESLNAQGIPTAVHYPISMHLQEAMQHLGYKKGDFPISERASERVMSLPMHPYLTDAEQQKVKMALDVALHQQKELA